MAKINLKKNAYWLAVAAAWTLGSIALLTCYYTLHVPAIDTLARVQQQYRESQDLLLIAKKATQPDVQESLQERFDQTGGSVRQFAVPAANTTGLVFEIGKIADELELSEFSCKIQPLRDFPTLEKNNTVSEAWLRIEFQASFLQFAHFINRLERHRPTVFIEQMTMRRNENDRQGGSVRMELSFLMMQEAESAAGTATVAGVIENRNPND